MPADHLGPADAMRLVMVPESLQPNSDGLQPTSDGLQPTLR